MKQETKPMTEWRTSHITFVILVIVMIIFGLWMYIVLEKSIADITEIGQQIRNENIVRQQRKSNIIAPSTVSTSAF